MVTGLGWRGKARAASTRAVPRTERTVRFRAIEAIGKRAGSRPSRVTQWGVQASSGSGKPSFSLLPGSRPTRIFTRPAKGFTGFWPGVDTGVSATDGGADRMPNVISAPNDKPDTPPREKSKRPKSTALEGVSPADPSSLHVLK